MPGHAIKGVRREIACQTADAGSRGNAEKVSIACANSAKMMLPFSKK